MAAKIVVVGSINMDLVAQTTRIPNPGETVLGGELSRHFGGKGANQAVASARLGAQVAMVGRVGLDDFGAAMRANLSSNGVNASHVKQDADAASGVALIVVDAQGQNSIVVTSGANMRVTPDDVDDAAPAFTGADSLLLQLEIPVESCVRAAELARRAGARVILNPAPAQPLAAAFLERVDVLIPNEHEAALLTGVATDTMDGCRDAAQALVEQGVPTVVMTLGGRGALLATREEMILVPAFEVKVVDTTAAGDAFVAGFATALGEGHDLREAVRRGNASGGLTATKAGAQSSLPTRADWEALLR